MFVSDLFPQDSIIFEEHGLANPMDKLVPLTDIKYIPLKYKALMLKLAKFHDINLGYDTKTKNWTAPVVDQSRLNPFLKDAIGMTDQYKDSFANRMNEESENHDEFVQQELAKYDINVERIVPSAGNKHFPQKHKLYIQGEDQPRANQILRQLGYSDEYEVVSAMGSAPSIKKEAFGQTEMDGTPIEEAFADQGAGHSPEESVAKKHRVSVTVVDPYIQNKDTSESQIEKFVRVTAKDRTEAENRAKQYYKKKGFRVIDAHYVSPVFEQATEVTEARKGFMYSENDDQAREHFIDYLYDHIGDVPEVNNVQEAISNYPMKNRAGIIGSSIKAGIIKDDAEDAYNAIEFAYDGTWE